MKRFAITLAFALIFCIISLAACTPIDIPLATDPTPTDPYPIIIDTMPTVETDILVSEVVYVVDIVDQTSSGEICTADALEGFYSDETYDYYFPSIKSGYIVVSYSDGTAEGVKEALAEGHITIADLDRFGIGYYKEEKNPPMYVMQIIDRTVTEGIPTDTALEKFWEDESAEYYFPSIKSEYVIVVCSNDVIYTIKEALENGMVTVGQLTPYNIGYITVEKSVESQELAVKKIINWAEEYEVETSPMEEVFYEDDLFRYYFHSLISDYIVVIYDADWQENIKTALKYGRASIEDLDKFGIDYCKEPKSELSNPNIKDIYDRVARGEIGIDNGEGMYDDVYDDPFYEDVEFYYVLSDTPYEGAFIVVYHDGTREAMIHAIAAGRITLSDLDAFGIKYYKEPK